ncbi:hypothetical protein Deipe_0188 [Deinococcus peraridilitoris DSM 19664]|uniref:Uncharacterized protein n=2 Tax=Deinococcus TaxID=1298 RepID=K9ZW47_DEIPD|nr:hypothetical protein Deipe_0188 [Deinococcus peraridilitoris DSM 19664]
MLELPVPKHDRTTETAFAAALRSRDARLLPADVPRWHFLEWLVGQGWLLHGSNHPDITRFEPRTPVDLSPDEFSKRTAVFAASDGVWAMMYALTDRARVRRILNMALRVRQENRWSEQRYFLSLAPHDHAVTEGIDLLRHGSVYVLSSAGFERMPPYEWPALGEVMEPHWASPSAVAPLMRVDVSPTDFLLPVRMHDAGRVDRLCQSDPWGFPWLESASGRSGN